MGATIMPLMLTSTGVLLTSAAARAESAPPDAFGFSLQASADAFKMDVETGLFGGAFPLVPADEPPLSGSAAHTEAAFDDLGNNDSLASAPYPGAFAVGMPGTFRAVSRPGGQPGIGQAPPLPDWPFVVSSTYPGREESIQANGPYRISATSGPAGSMAAAKVGVLGPASVLSPASRSNAAWDAKAGTFVAEADSSFAALRLDPVLELADVEAHVALTAAPGADKPAMTSSFEVGTMTVAGVKVGVTDKGFLVGPNAQPRPDLGPLAGALSPAGITIEFLPAETTPKGIRSAGMRITSTQDFPVQGPVKQTWTAGRVSASLDPGISYDAFSAYDTGPWDGAADVTGAESGNSDPGRPRPSSAPPADVQAVAVPAAPAAPEPPPLLGPPAPTHQPAADGEPGGQDCQPGWKRFGSECYPNVAVITPTLGFFSFGATFGGPIMCFLGTSAVLSAGRGAGAAAVTNEVGKAATPYCSSGPNQFGDGVAQLDKQLGPLTAINPVVNPVLDNVANGFRSFATSNASTIAPFGPAAHQMGSFVEYFKGS
jgi:hypothetical protein